MPLWLAPQPLALASRSPARRAMLEAAGIPIDLAAVDIDERAVEARARPASGGEAAVILASEKAIAGSARRPGRIVVGADQTLVLGSRLFAKPENRASAKDQLRALSGRCHELHSAVAVARDKHIIFSYLDGAQLTMRAISEQFIDHYLEEIGPRAMSSVGAYQLEGLGSQLFDKIVGDYFTILGLPLLPLLAFLRREGFLAA
jgi:nucleoside triphosphate pyrophosphatase